MVLHRSLGEGLKTSKDEGGGQRPWAGVFLRGGSEKAGRPLSRFVRDKRLILLSRLLELSKVTGESFSLLGDSLLYRLTHWPEGSCFHLQGNRRIDSALRRGTIQPRTCQCFERMSADRKRVGGRRMRANSVSHILPPSGRWGAYTVSDKAASPSARLALVIFDDGQDADHNDRTKTKRSECQQARTMKAKPTPSGRSKNFRQDAVSSCSDTHDLGRGQNARTTISRQTIATPAIMCAAYRGLSKTWGPLWPRRKQQGAEYSSLVGSSRPITNEYPARFIPCKRKASVYTSSISDLSIKN